MLVLKQRDKADLDSDQALAKALIQPGVTLYGFCGGRFGRDSYSDKEVVSVNGNEITVKTWLCGVECTLTSNEITDWVGLVESSNQACEESS